MNKLTLTVNTLNVTVNGFFFFLFNMILIVKNRRIQV